MTVFDVEKNKAICVLPWIHEFRQVGGSKIAPCCQADNLRDNETMASLREDMLSGIQPRACNSCYHKEEKSGWSPRIADTVRWIKKFGEPNINSPELGYIDLRFDPTCNLKCKTCGPKFSTLWQKEKKVSLPANISNAEYFKTIEKKHLKKVYLAGGEPTYIKAYHDFFEELYLINPKCEVVVNTNLKRLSDSWKQIIKKFENLSIVCSCDAIQTLGTYVRYPLKWEEFEDNVKFVKEHANFLVFNLVASNLTTHKIHETCTWMQKYSKNITLSPLNNPESMSELAVPLDMRQSYINSLEKLTKFGVSPYYAMDFRSKIQFLIKRYKESAYDVALHRKLTDEISEQDSHRTLKLHSVDSFLHSWIYR